MDSEREEVDATAVRSDPRDSTTADEEVKFDR